MTWQTVVELLERAFARVSGMAVLLWAGGLVSWWCGAACFRTAKTVLHEIAGVEFWIVSAVLVAGGCVVQKLHGIGRGPRGPA